MSLRPCPGCRRHVAAEASSCPFCSAPIGPPPIDASVARAAGAAPLGRWTRAAVFAGAVASGSAAGCYTGSQPRYEQLPASDTTTSSDERAGQVRGTVTRDDGDAPAANTHVTLFGDRLRALPGGTDALSTQTAPNGRFEFDAIPPGDYVLSIVGASRRRPITVRPGQATILDVDLPPPPRPDPRHMAKPYGAPPARRRVV